MYVLLIKLKYMFTGYYKNTNGDNCIARLVGDTCTSSGDCLPVIQNSYCYAGKCKCQDRFRLLESLTTCFKRMYSLPAVWSSIVLNTLVTIVQS